MKIKRIIKIGLVIFILIAVTILAICVKNYISQKRELKESKMQLKESMQNFSMLIESENLDDLTLTIYYMSFFILTRGYLSANDLINYTCDNKIVVSGELLKEHIDLLKQLGSVNLEPVIKKSYLDARLYYIFETEEDGKILDVVICLGSTFVNGIKVKYNKVLYNVLIPFLTEDARNELEMYFGHIY